MNIRPPRLISREIVARKAFAATVRFPFSRLLVARFSSALPVLNRVPVVSLRLEPHHSYVVETVTTQYGVPMETLRALAVDLCVRDELRALGFVDEFELLGTERQRIDLDELDAVGVVHAQRRRELAGDEPVSGSLQAPIDFVQYDDVGGSKGLRVFQNLRGAGRILRIARPVDEFLEFHIARESGPYLRKLDAALDVPLNDAQRRPEVLDKRLERAHAPVRRAIVHEWGCQQRIEFLLKRRRRHVLLGKRGEFVECEELWSRSSIFTLCCRLQRARMRRERRYAQQAADGTADVLGDRDTSTAADNFSRRDSHAAHSSSTVAPIRPRGCPLAPCEVFSLHGGRGGRATCAASARQARSVRQLY